MSWQRTPYFLPMLAAAAVSITTALYLFMRRRHSPRTRIGTLLLLAGAAWMLGSAFESASADLPSKVQWDKLQFVGICIIPPALLAYVLHHTGRDRWLTPVSRIAISIVPCITFLLVLTNEAHGLIWRDAWLDTSRQCALKQAINGPALWAFTAYAYALLLVGVLFLVRELVRSSRLYRWQATALLVAVMTPWLLNVLVHVLGWTTLGGFELTPIALAVAVPVIAWSFYRLQVRDIVPVAREAVIDSMDDVIVVLDPEGRIVDLNRAAQRLFGRARSALLGTELDELWPEYPGWTASSHEEGSPGKRLTLAQDGEQRDFTLRTSPVTDWRGQIASHVVVLHDNTELQRRTDELATILEATKVVASSLDLDQVLGLITEEMLNAVGVDGCTLSRWDREQDAIVTLIEQRRILPECADEPDAAYPLRRFPLTRSVLESRQPQVVRLSDPDAGPEEVARMQSLEREALLMLPLAHRDRVIGLVELDSEQDRQFTPDEIRLCQLLADQAAIAIEHTRLYQESKSRLEELSALLRVGMTITSALDHEDILAAVAETAVFMLRATSAYVCRWDGTQHTTTVVAEAFDQSASAKERISGLGVTHAGESFFAHILEKNQPYALRLSDPGLPDDWRSHLEEHGAKSLLVLPLICEEETRIHLELWESRHDRRFTEHEVLLGLNLTSQAAVALQNARLYDQAQQEIAEWRQVEAVLRQRNRELLSLQAASTATALSLDRQFVLDTVAWEMANLLQVDDCTILEWDRGSDTISVIAHYGTDSLPEGTRGAEDGDLADYPFRRQVMSERAPWQTTVGASAHEPTELAHLQQAKARTLLVLPLVFQDRVLGLVEVKESHVERSFNDREVTLAQMLAGHAAMAIENARLYEQAQQEIAMRKEAEEALEGYAAELERSNQELQQFAYVASHDLQEPLRMVTSYLQLLQKRYKGQLGADADDFIHYAVDGAQRMREVIQGLLAYSRVGSHGAPFETVDSHAVLCQVLDNLQVAIAENEAVVTHGSLPTVVADPTQLSQLLQNLIGNAIKFRSDDRPEIRVDAQQQKGDADGETAHWLISVRDNGIGIEPQYAERIFVVFQRLHTPEEYPGTGIGLAICKRIVERHGGRIWVESVPGQGSTFFFSIPHRR